MTSLERRVTGPGQSLPFAPGFVPLWIVAVLMTWWTTDRRLLPPSFASSGPWSGPALVAALTRLALFSLEALVYVSAWRALGVRLRWFPLALWVLSFSMFDALAARVAELGRLHPGAWGDAARWLAGPAAVDGAAGSASPGARAAFGSVGLLDAARIAAWCEVQRRASRRPWTQAWTLTLGLWAASRVVLWWGLDLLRGRSLLP